MHKIVTDNATLNFKENIKDCNPGRNGQDGQQKEEALLD